MTPEELAAFAEELSKGLPQDPRPETGFPSSVPGYTLGRIIGKGGSGTVYRGTKADGKDPVAIKIVTAARARDALRHAEREVELLRSFDSPFTPRVFEMVELSNGVAIVSEFIHGLHIDQHAACKDLSTKQCAALLADAANAAAACHEVGLVHRDLKPSNILIKADGSPVIIDFGIATQIRPDSHQTRLEVTTGAGTPAFMPPEQADDTLGQLSTRTDVWALGAIGYVLLTGEPPHDLENTSPLANLRRIMDEQPRPPRSIDPSIPKPLAAILAKACDRNPDRRYTNAGDLALDLRRWINSEPITAQSPSAWTKATHWAGRHPIATTAIACSVLIGSTLAGTAGTLHVLLQRPYGVKVSADRREAFIVSRGGSRLATIARAEGEGAVLSADKMEMLGGRWLAVVSSPVNNAANKVVSVWDPSNLSSPSWTAPDPGPFPPLAIECYDDDTDQSSHGYNDQFIVADVFPSLPGEELMVHSNGGPDFPSSIRIFDSTGEQCYKVWIPGIGEIQWLAGPRSIIYAGANNRLDTGPRRGGQMPQMIAAIHPVLQPPQMQERWLTWGIPDSETNAERCLELVQPATHATGIGDDIAGSIVFNAVPRMATGRFPASEHFTLWLEIAEEQQIDANARITLNADFQQTGEIICNNALESTPRRREFVETRWGTDVFGLREARPFDPNPSDDSTPDP